MFLEYALKRTTQPYDPTLKTPTHNLDSWNLDRVYEVQRVGDSLTRLRGGKPIVNVGSWECAIAEKGAPDLIGSYAHGDEVLTDASLLVDGQAQDPQIGNRFYAKELVFNHHSTLYRCNSRVPVADYRRKYTITVEGIELTQDLDWIEPMEVKNAYLAMLPIKRNIDDTSGEAVTDTARRDGGVEEDISAPGFPMRYTVGTRKVEVWGRESGISASVEILEQTGLPDPVFNFSPAPQYNKLYFDFANKHVVKAGDRWHLRAKFRLDTAN